METNKTENNSIPVVCREATQIPKVETCNNFHAKDESNRGYSDIFVVLLSQ